MDAPATIYQVLENKRGEKNEKGKDKRKQRKGSTVF